MVSSAFEENVGLFVDVLGPWLPGQCGIDGMFDDGHLWRCKAKGEIRYTSVCGELVYLSEGPIPDRCLRPIRPGQKGDGKKVIREIDMPQFA